MAGRGAIGRRGAGARRIGRVVLLAGTPSEAVRLAPVARALIHRRGLEPVVVVLADQDDAGVAGCLEDLGTPVDVVVDTSNGSHPAGEGPDAVLGALGPVLAELAPAALLVEGEATMPMAGALCAHYEGLPLGHLGAGVWSGRQNDPVRDELARRLIHRATLWHFVPTRAARERLIGDEDAPDSVHLTGSTVVDSLRWLLDQGRAGPSGFVTDRPRKVLVALREASRGDPPIALVRSLVELSRQGDTEVLLPLRLDRSPRSLPSAVSGVVGATVVDPLGYPAFVGSLAACDLVLTDAGGVEEEAGALGKPVLRLGRAPGRPEGAAAGTSRAVDTDPDLVAKQAAALLDDPGRAAAMVGPVNPYGDGLAGERIVDVL
jgi:UDP-N-acetylglucosamine 2-epimerase (non-hydrolysing)